MEIIVTILKMKAPNICTKLQSSVYFEGNAKKDSLVLINKEKEQIENFLLIETRHVNRLPNSFRDYTHTKELEDLLKNIVHRKNNVVSAETFGNLILVICGRYIKYGYLTEDKQQKLSI